MSPLRSTLRATSMIGLAVGLLAGPAKAGTIPYAELGYDNALLRNFNLVTLGDYKASASNDYAYTQGRAIIGGNATAGTGSGAAFCTGVNCTNTTSAVDSTKQSYGAATIFGNVTGFSSLYLAAGYNTTNSNLYVGGNASGAIFANNKTDLSIAGSSSGLNVYEADNIYTRTWSGTTSGTRTGRTYTGVSAASVFPFTSAALGSEVNNLSKGLAALPGSPGVGTTSSSGSIFFTAASDYVSGGKTYGVITTSIQDLAKLTNFGGINNGSREATFVIVTGADASTTYNLPNLNSYTGSNRVIFDFVDAKSISFSGAWSGSILAPLATISSMGGSIDGSVIVASINQSQSLISSNLFAGDLLGLVPEPASLALLGVGILVAGVARRRRQ